MRRSTLLRSAVTTVAATAISISTLAACPGATGPVDYSSYRDSSSATGKGGRGPDVALVIIPLRAPLDGPYRSANGKAKFKSEGGERELEVEVEDVRAGLELLFLLDDIRLGTRTTDAYGRANLELNSDRGASVPSAVAGRKVTIQTTAGVTVVSGSF